MTGDQSSQSTHALYRFYSDSGQLLYVGITLNPGSRWKQHSKDKPWWHDVVRVAIERHPTRALVLEAERAAIISERPRYNVIHNGPTPGAVNTGADMPDMCHDYCVAAGDWEAFYYPFRWDRGVAQYECARGHWWTCGWGHDASGSDRGNAGVNQASQHWRTA